MLCAGPSRRSLSRLVVVLTLVLGGCSQPDPSAARPLQRIELARADGVAAERATPTAVRQLSVPPDLGSWVVDPGPCELVTEPVGTDGKQRTGIHLKQLGVQHVRIPGPFDPAEFDRITVVLRSEKTTPVVGRLRRDGKVAQAPVRRPISISSPELQTVDLDYTHVATGSRPYDELDLLLRLTRPVTLFGVELVRVPPAARLPQVVDGPALFSIGDDARRSVGLSTRTPLVGRFDVPVGGALAVSCGWPSVSIEKGVELRLVVRVEGPAGAVIEKSFRVPPKRWRQSRIDLTELGRGVATASFSLHSSAAGESLCALGTPSVFAPQVSPATVLLAISDTHRYDHLSSSGQGVDVRTPVLDELAARGISFDRCYTSANVTLPSHVALMTGSSPRDTRVLDNYSPISAGALTLAERFRDAGYRTLAVVSTHHLGDPVSGLGQGFDRMCWPEFDVAEAGASIDVLKTWVEDCEEQPLFVWLHLFDAHTPYDAPEEFVRVHYPEDRDPSNPALPEADFPLPSGFEGVRDVEYPRAVYRAEIGYMDDQLRRVFEQERFRTATVAFTADHGENLGQHGVWWDHSGLYPDSLHVPLILSWPGGPAGVREARGVRQTDVSRTLLDLAGLEHVDFPGSSLVAAGDPSERASFAISSLGMEASITVGSWHLILSLRRHPLGNVRKTQYKQVRELHQVELYDLSTDPGCALDLVEERRETAARLRTRLIDWLLDAQDMGVRGEGSLDQETLDSLAQLGYATDLGDEGWDEEFFDRACECPQCDPFRALD